MATINRKLGNGFIFNTVDSTTDQDHYFGDHQKTLNLSIHGAPINFSGSTVLSTGTIFNGIAYNYELNKLFVCGQHQVTSALSGVLGAAWVLSSSDQGASWHIVDDYVTPTQSSSSAEDVCYEFASSSMLVAGWHVTTGAHTGNNSQINGLIRYLNPDTPAVTAKDIMALSASETKLLWIDTAFVGDIKSFSGVPPVFDNEPGAYCGGYCLTSSGDNPSRALIMKKSYYDAPHDWQVDTLTAVSGTANTLSGVFYDGIASPWEALFRSMCGIVGLTGGFSTGFFEFETIEDGWRNYNFFGNRISSNHGAYTDISTRQKVSGSYITFGAEESVLGYTCGFSGSITSPKSWVVGRLASKFVGPNPISGTVDKFSPNGEAIANKIIVDDLYALEGNTIINKSVGSNMYVVGYHKKDATDKKYWTIRHSPDTLARGANSDYSASWATVEAISQGDLNEAKNGCFDIYGNLYVCGQINGVGTVRKYPSSSLATRSHLDVFSITGSQEVALKQELYDEANNKIADFERLSASFGYGILSSSGNTLLFPRMSFMVSCSNGTFNVDDFYVKYKDDHSSGWRTFQSYRGTGELYLQSDGWYKFVSRHATSTQLPSIEFFSSSIHWIVTGSGDDINYSFKNFRVDFIAPMTTAGVEYYKKLDNQYINKKSNYFNFNLLKQDTLLSKGNFTEFPHASGFFQMPNLIKGTQTTGKVGLSDDNIVQAKFIGSVVNVLWPKQDVSSNVRGFGDFSAGQRAGKLTTTFVAGQEFDVSEFDHLSLYCYLRKEVSGTLDKVLLIVERKPLQGLGFTTEQSIEYAISGSKTSATLRDIEINKSIDYGDLTVREIGYPIDVPLENVKFIRVSARHENGQEVDENKNFVVWGRLIKSAEET